MSTFKVIINIFTEYDINEKFRGLVFDKTATNTDKHKRILTRLYEWLQKPILHQITFMNIKNISKVFRKIAPDNYKIIIID